MKKLVCWNFFFKKLLKNTGRTMKMSSKYNIKPMKFSLNA